MTIARARALRSRPTDAETKLWNALRKKQLDGHRFRRQVPLGPYIVDFLCLECRIVVEIDGGQHADSSADDVRTKWLEGFGLTVVRYWNNEVLGNLDGVLIDLRIKLTDAKRRERPPHPDPPPRGGRK